MTSVKERYETSLMWFRRDLRIEDNRALAHATYYSKKVIPVFILDTEILENLPLTDRRITFLEECIEDLRAHLREHDSDLILLSGKPSEELAKFAKKVKAKAVFTNRDYEVSAKRRDENVKKNLLAEKIEFHSYKDAVIFEAQEVKTQAGEYYKVFTAYKNQWLKTLALQKLENAKSDLQKLVSAKEISSFLDKNTFAKMGFQKQENILSGGRKQALKKWLVFQKHIGEYKQTRDFPALEGTSMLSPYLRFGCLSPRELVLKIEKQKNIGATTWLSEIIWRDFYHMILDVFPHVETGAFKAQYDTLVWPGLAAHFQTWIDGKTGYPLVDAAMRYFAATGWMHNRMRMVVAMFLTKDLLVHWKKGEEYFAKNLLDYDKAANNGGWQWSASTGCDAQPYFRIFNPYSQSERFDPKGNFIRKHLPELQNMPDKYIHAPHKAPIEIQKQARCILGKDYPLPIVEHDVQRKKALLLFKKS